ncbi:hypothetical protein [Fischerella sp. PCC 9605]|nr:hypothetical protein [Fischerella sp. PCC 9605]
MVILHLFRGRSLRIHAADIVHASLRPYGLNGSLNFMHKTIPNAFAEGI